MSSEPREPAPEKAVLKIKVRENTSRHALAPDELVTIGRSSHCGIQVRDASVSREHCVAIFTDGVVCVNDLRSTHGISHRGERVDRCRLEPGDTCHLGSALLRFELPAGAAAPRPDDPPPAEPAQDAHDAHDAPGGADADDAPSDPAPPDAASADDGPSDVGPSDDGPSDDGPSDDGPPDAASAGTAPTGATPARAAPAARAPSGSGTPTTAVPARVGNYRIVEQLGEGGYGTVYRAEQEPLGREVALKVMKGGAGDLQERVDAFVDEARAAARIADPHLVQVFEVGEVDGVHYLSMELVEGGSLARRIRRDGPRPWPEVLDLLHDVGAALAAAHDAGIVHRDVKPANILLAADGTAKLGDLGMASGASHGGTVAFMAPEQLRKADVDARSDLYALGVTAYAALTGSPPFTGSKAEIARAHVRQTPPSLQDRSVMVPYHLQQLIVTSLMAKSPEDRPQSARALLERLDRLILPSGSIPSPADDDGPRPAPRVSRGASRQKRLAARLTAEAITVGLVSLVLIVTLLLLKIGWDVDIYRLIGR